MHRIGVIGTAGRKIIITEKMYKKAYDGFCEYLSNYPDEFALISGGAAFMDHLAVIYCLDHPSTPLIIKGPSRFENGEFVGNASSNIANFYHTRFEREINGHWIGRPGITLAIKKGAIYEAYDGFTKRNQEIAKAVNSLYTISEGDTFPTTPGTRHTWDYFTSLGKTNTIFVPLESLKK